eukprot:392093_1
MGNHLHFCSPQKHAPANAELTQRNTESSTSSDEEFDMDMVEEEKIILNDMVLDLTQKLAAQQMKNRLLKQELHTINEQNKQNLEVIEALHSQQRSYNGAPRSKKVSFNEFNSKTSETVSTVSKLVSSVYKSSICILSDEDDLETEYSDAESSYVDEEEQEITPTHRSMATNLFRCESNQKWDFDAIAQKKKEMQTAMTQHIIQQLKTSNNVM